MTMSTRPYNALPALQQLLPARFESATILKKLVSAHRHLAELKGLVQSVPNPGVLVNSLGLQEAKDSSEIENIVTTHDALFRESLQPETSASAATKEVARYLQALDVGWRAVQAIQHRMSEYKHAIRAKHRFYSQDLINLLFSHPYSKIDFLQKVLKVSRLTAMNYLNRLTDDGFLQKHKVGRDNYYINTALFNILTGGSLPPVQP